jgi:hypothetical protein
MFVESAKAPFAIRQAIGVIHAAHEAYLTSSEVERTQKYAAKG